MNPLIHLRHILHQHPEIAGEETETAQRILEFFKPLQADEVIKNLGGTGLAFIFKGKNPGKRLLFRSELDALPIEKKVIPDTEVRFPARRIFVDMMGIWRLSADWVKS